MVYCDVGGNSRSRRLAMSGDEASDRFGIVYVLQNPAFQETIIKIGSTENLANRIDQLSRNTSVPARFTCYYARRVENVRYVEKQLHAGLGSRRISPNREFFDVDPQEAKSLLEIAQGEDVTPENELKNATDAEKRLAKRSMFRLKDFGINPGEVLTYVNDDSVEATVYEDGKSIILGDKAPEELKGRVFSLSAAAGQLLGYRVAGPDHWRYKGKTLNQIRGEAEAS